MISSATQVPQGSTMAALSCLHWGGGLRSLPRYPAAQGLFRERVGWTTALAWTQAPEESRALCHQHGDRGLRRQLTVVWGSGVSACSVHVLREGWGWGQSSISSVG